jgi:hypothetical protein
MCKGKHRTRPGLISLLLVSLLLCACGGGGGDKSSSTQKVASTVNGTAQKGPYPFDTPVTIYQLDSQGNRSGARVTTIIGVFGNFIAELPWNGPSEAEVNGIYYDELNAAYSTSPQRLNVFFVADETDDVLNININLFTRLASARTRVLTANGQDLSAAMDLARDDIKSMFQLQLADSGTLASLDLTNGSGQYAEDNANLLLFSAAILSAGIDSQALSSLEADFAEDGQINGAGMSDWVRLCAMATTFNLDNVSLNVESLAWILDAPDFSDLNFTYPAWVGIGNDRDADGLDDHEEILTYLSDPLDSDTDGDGIPDGWETLNGLDLLLNDAALDPDNDGLANLSEFRNLTNPLSADTDNDTYPDSQELALGGDPLDINSLPLVFTSTPGLAIDATRTYGYSAATTWPTASFTLASGPAGMSVDPVSGLLSWTPDLAQTGTYNVVLDANDKGYTASQSFIIDVAVFNTGDINEDSVVDAKDWLLAQRISLGFMVPTTDQLNRGDIKLDGQISGADVLLIERLALDL